MSFNQTKEVKYRRSDGTIFCSFCKKSYWYHGYPHCSLDDKKHRFKSCKNLDLKDLKRACVNGGEGYEGKVHTIDDIAERQQQKNLIREKELNRGRRFKL